jgi:hypothetical protein
MSETEIVGCRFADEPQVLGIDALPLPKREGVVRHEHFRGCKFHPNCFTSFVKYHGCTFEKCEGIDPKVAEILTREENGSNTIIL